MLRSINGLDNGLDKVIIVLESCFNVTLYASWKKYDDTLLTELKITDLYEDLTHSKLRN